MKFIKKFFVQLFMGANVATILLMWAACGVTYLSPESFPRLGLLSLAFPAFLLVNVLFVVFWLIFKIKRVWVPVVGLLCCGSFVRDYFPVNIPCATPDSTLTVLSYNTHSFGGGSDADAPDGSNPIMTYLLSTDADILCLVESTNRRDFIERFVAAGYECMNIKEFMLCSRLPIVEADTMSLGTQRAHCLRAYLLDGSDTIMVLAPHLESNHLSPEVKSAYVEAIKAHERDSVRKGVEPVVELLSEASPTRARQVQDIQAAIDAWLPRPIILGGDFNDTPISYTHRVLTSHLTSAWRQSGNGLGFTFHDKGFPVRIDHILFSGDRWKSYETTICDTIKHSDHFPICTKLAKIGP